MTEKEISVTTLRRLPVYLHYLNSIKGDRKNISSVTIAAAFGLNEVQVRKDLGAVSGSGRPKTGYDVEQLIGQIEQCLGYGSETKTILVGAGNLGKALLSYHGFSDYGLDIIAAFDLCEAVVGTIINGKPVLPLQDVEVVCQNKNIKLGIITTPVKVAQEICDRLIACGIKAIWNFAPTILRVPDNVLIENENLASSLAILSKHLREDYPEDCE
ncbi:MAG TPA: redox-sensing transcriptional repressor Rex [Oscillospiraceae bacterium]|nr:redox-sensing transcriptional repressor Rex [Oscillospiraceae bacterium]HPS33962.1 redox-sensing transcriptional repressor Rex [Oscillospiraceae bacterium]